MFHNIRKVLYHGTISEIKKVDVNSSGHEEAYRRLVSTDFFGLLNDLDTGLYLESDAYLLEACLLELEKSPDAMYEFIGRE